MTQDRHQNEQLLIDGTDARTVQIKLSTVTVPLNDEPSLSPSWMLPEATDAAQSGTIVLGSLPWSLGQRFEDHSDYDEEDDDESDWDDDEEEDEDWDDEDDEEEDWDEDEEDDEDGDWDDEDDEEEDWDEDEEDDEDDPDLEGTAGEDYSH